MFQYIEFIIKELQLRLRGLKELQTKGRIFLQEFSGKPKDYYETVDNLGASILIKKLINQK